MAPSTIPIGMKYRKLIWPDWPSAGSWDVVFEIAVEGAAVELPAVCDETSELDDDPVVYKKVEVIGDDNKVGVVDMNATVLDEVDAANEMRSIGSTAVYAGIMEAVKRETCGYGHQLMDVLAAVTP
jgi:hypothetical protein